MQLHFTTKHCLSYCQSLVVNSVKSQVDRYLCVGSHKPYCTVYTWLWKAVCFSQYCAWLFFSVIRSKSKCSIVLLHDDRHFLTTIFTRTEFIYTLGCVAGSVGKVSDPPIINLGSISQHLHIHLRRVEINVVFVLLQSDDQFIIYQGTV